MHKGNQVAYFDGPSGTQVPRQVADAVSDYLLEHNANRHWHYPTSMETDLIITSAREAVADLLGASPREIAFGANMTSLTFHLSRALGREYGPGDEIVITELDHHANVAPWQALEKERGITLHTIKFDKETSRLDWKDLERKLSPGIRLLAIGSASNALGTITDVGRAIEMAHSVGARVFVDAVHGVPHTLTDVRDWDCDFLACSAYKFYGPHIGILYGKYELLEELDVAKVIPAPENTPDRFETGTQNYEGIAGTTAVVDFLASLGSGSNRRESLAITFEELHERGNRLITRLWNGLESFDTVTLFGPRPGTPRTPTLSFIISGISSAEVAITLADKGIFVTNGDFYARTVVERLGLQEEGLVRAGCTCYTNEEEIDRFIEAVASMPAI